MRVRGSEGVRNHRVFPKSSIQERSCWVST